MDDSFAATGKRWRVIEKVDTDGEGAEPAFPLGTRLCIGMEDEVPCGWEAIGVLGEVTRCAKNYEQLGEYLRGTRKPTESAQPAAAASPFFGLAVSCKNCDFLVIGAERFSVPRAADHLAEYPDHRLIYMGA